MDDNQSLMSEMISSDVMRFPVGTQQWSNETDNILCGISDYSKCMARLCIYVSEYHQSQRTYLLGPAAVLSWGLTIFGMFATYYGNQKLPDATVILINSLINFIIATFTTVAEKSQAGSKIELFQQLARDFFNLSGTISMELSKEPSSRVCVTPFVGNINARYKDLENSVPPLPQALITKFTSYMEEANGPAGQDLWHMIAKPNMLSSLSPTNKYNWDNDTHENGLDKKLKQLIQLKQAHDAETDIFKKMKCLEQDHDEETGEALKKDHHPEAYGGIETKIS
jgi:hypothetical protein